MCAGMLLYCSLHFQTCCPPSCIFPAAFGKLSWMQIEIEHVWRPAWMINFLPMLLRASTLGLTMLLRVRRPKVHQTHPASVLQRRLVRIRILNSPSESEFTASRSAAFASSFSDSTGHTPHSAFSCNNLWPSATSEEAAMFWQNINSYYIPHLVSIWFSAHTTR